MVVFPIAKLNIGLYVTDRREDGYHNIETLFYPIGLSDILEVVPDPGSLPGSLDLSLSGLRIEGNSGTNLVAKAYRLLDKQVGLPGVKAFLHKCIPTGAGLGGGSSDGTSMLLLLNRIFDLNLSECDLTGLALQLGSDCPYFIYPEPSFAKGRGEEICSANITLRGYYLLLFHPGTGISTAAAYQHVAFGKPGIGIEILEKVKVEGWRDIAFNAFEPYAFMQQPVIKYIKDALYRCGAVYASMTGSGSAVFGLFDRDVAVPPGISDYLIWKERLWR
jgi:4-diphosphocytidyl-2-C-methyl-D-erythritol kinase